MKLQLGVWIALTCLADRAWAGGTRQEPGQGEAPSPAREGFYLELHGAWAQLGGDFDGSTVLTGSTDSIVVPDADSGMGFGLALGKRWERQALELAFTQTQHDGSIPGLSGGDVSYSALDVNWRYFFRTQQSLQPFLQAGLGAAFATLEDASSNGASVGDGDLSGVRLGLGGGAEYYFAERWSLGARVLYRYASFDTAEGVAGDEGSIDESVDAGGLGFELGLTFTL